MKYAKKLNYIGAIDDVRAEDTLLRSSIDFLKEKNVEEIFCVGDIVDGKGDVDRCCDILIEEKVITVLEDRDRWLLNNEMRNLKEAHVLKDLSKNNKSFLRQLPITVEFFTYEGLGLLCHGLEQNDMARITPEDYGYSIEVNADLQKILTEQKYKYIVNGHTHYPMVRKINNITIINAGTLKREHKPCFSIIDFSN
jgi:predicted phosphodiesterase